MGEYAEMAIANGMAEFTHDGFNKHSENKFTKHRKLNDKVWLKENGKTIAMVEMNSTHVQNCINLLKKAHQTEFKAFEGLVAELEKRKAK